MGRWLSNGSPGKLLRMDAQSAIRLLVVRRRIGKLPIDGWCAEARTAYQFHGFFFHGCPKCYDQTETNSVNGKTMAALLEKTRCNTAYLRRHVEVVEMWECEWKEIRKEQDVKSFLRPSESP